MVGRGMLSWWIEGVIATIYIRGRKATIVYSLINDRVEQDASVDEAAWLISKGRVKAYYGNMKHAVITVDLEGA